MDVLIYVYKEVPVILKSHQPAIFRAFLFFSVQVAGLAVVSVICFTSSAFVALFTDIPVCNHHPQALQVFMCLYF